jgi:hypothetical protein
MLSIFHDVDLWIPYLLDQNGSLESQVFSRTMNFIRGAAKMGDQAIWP